MTAEVSEPVTGPRVADLVISIILLILGFIGIIALFAPVGCTVHGFIAVASVVR